MHQCCQKHKLTRRNTKYCHNMSSEETQAPSLLLSSSSTARIFCNPQQTGASARQFPGTVQDAKLDGKKCDLLQEARWRARFSEPLEDASSREFRCVYLDCMPKPCIRPNGSTDTFVRRQQDRPALFMAVLVSVKFTCAPSFGVPKKSSAVSCSTFTSLAGRSI